MNADFLKWVASLSSNTGLNNEENVLSFAKKGVTAII